jgi:hypothetical protein
MSITTYAELQSAIASWLARDDLTAYIPDFITLFECEAALELKVRPQETTTTLTPSSGVATLPSDYLGYRRVTWTGSPTHDLDYVHPTLLTFDNPGSVSAIPTEFTISGSSLTVSPSDDTALSFTYYQKTPAVSGSLNWLFTNYPNIYLFGSLVEANAFNKGKAFEHAALWKARRDEGFAKLAMRDFNERAGMTMRVLGSTP